MKKENRILAIINGYKIFVGNHGFCEPAKKKRNENNFKQLQRSCSPKILAQYREFSPTWLSCRLHPSKHAVKQCPSSSKLGECSLPMQRMKVVLSMPANSAQRVNPFMPSKTLLQPNDLNIDRRCSKIHTGDCLITKAKHDCAELQNCYMPLLTNEVCPTYPNIGSGKTWDHIQEVFRLRMWQECCKCLLNENMKEVEKALKEPQGLLQSFEDATNINPPSTVEAAFQLAQRQELCTGIEKLEAKLAKVTAATDAGPPAMAQDWYPVEWVAWLHFGPSREFQYGPDSWLSPRNGTYASSGPEPSLHNKDA
jgi:hypothetical protein